MLHAIIMAGGTGTRFWPASRATTPKQLLSLVGAASMIRQTVARLEYLVSPDRILVVTNRSLIDSVQRQLPELPSSSLVGEPCKRDTAPCIGLAALLVSRKDANATMAVMPADHVIRPTESFQAAIRQATNLVNQHPEKIVTFGIRPSYAAEIFGYIQRGAMVEMSAGSAPTYQVEKFREKPDAVAAAKYLASGDFYWNSGIFVWRAKTIQDALAKHQPKMLAHLQTIVDAWETDSRQKIFQREFTAIEGLSIDYAVMEHATDVAVIEAPYEWDDLGGWQSLARLAGCDADGNTLIGRHLAMQTSETIIKSSEDHLVVALGLTNCIIVHTPDATLVANKHDEESIRAVVRELEARGWDEYL